MHVGKDAYLEHFSLQVNFRRFEQENQKGPPCERHHDVRRASALGEHGTEPVVAKEKHAEIEQNGQRNGQGKAQRTIDGCKSPAGETEPLLDILFCPRYTVRHIDNCS